MSIRQLFRYLTGPEQTAVAAGWCPSRQINRIRIWPSWHPIITGEPRRVPLTEATREQLGMEYGYVMRRGALARRCNGRLP